MPSEIKPDRMQGDSIVDDLQDRIVAIGINGVYEELKFYYNQYVNDRFKPENIYVLLLHKHERQTLAQYYDMDKGWLDDIESQVFNRWRGKYEYTFMPKVVTSPVKKDPVAVDRYILVSRHLGENRWDVYLVIATKEVLE